jgi:hypothetical protein
MKFRSWAVVAACIFALLPISAIPAVAETLSTDPPVHLGEGQAVGARLVQDPAVKIEQATSSYFITSYGDPNDHSPEPWQILSTADGSVVRTSPRLRENPVKAPTLLGKYILDIAPGMATFRDIGTDVLSQVDVPAGATFQGVYPGGILTRGCRPRRWSAAHHGPEQGSDRCRRWGAAHSEDDPFVRGPGAAPSGPLRRG